jgi:ribonuclease HII
VAAVALRPQRAAALTRRGVCDSKAFGAGADAVARRADLATHVSRLADFVGVEVLEHSEVDDFTSRGLLNLLERQAARRLIEAAPSVQRIVADGVQVFGPLRREHPHLQAVNDGESAHVAVAAASIVAKDHRDRLFTAIAERYREEFGEVRGGGYVNAATADFIRRYHQRYGCLPPETRRSWTWSVLVELEPPPLPLFDRPEPPAEA